MGAAIRAYVEEETRINQGSGKQISCLEDKIIECACEDSSGLLAPIHIIFSVTRASVWKIIHCLKGSECLQMVRRVDRVQGQCPNPEKRLQRNCEGGERGRSRKEQGSITRTLCSLLQLLSSRYAMRDAGAFFIHIQLEFLKCVWPVAQYIKWQKKRSDCAGAHHRSAW